MSIKKNLTNFTTDTNLLEHIIAAWLKENSAKSVRTGEQYTRHITHFREYVRSVSHDLLDADVIVILAKEWAAKGTLKETVASATYHQRLISLSSFYNYARKLNQVPYNPINHIERLPIFYTDAAKPLPIAEVRTQLQTIDRSSLLGLRDYALLAIAFTTGRRVSETASLHWRNIALSGERVCISWERCKGGRDQFDELAISVTDALLAYLHALHGEDLSLLPPAMPVWVSRSRNNSKGKAIGTQAIAALCTKYFGTSKSNTTRTTYASAIERADEERVALQAPLEDLNCYPPSIYITGLLSDIPIAVV